MSTQHLQILADGEELTNAAHALVTALATEAIGKRGFFNVALAGGSTPRPLYAQLAADGGIDWARWRLFFSDERTVPPDSEASNFHMVEAALLKPLLGKQGAQPASAVRMQGELEPGEAAHMYEQSVREIVGPFVQGVEGSANLLDGVPRFDLILLGMGDDGHTASLFPHTEALGERERFVVANWVPKFDAHRLTFTYPLLNAAHYVCFLVSGRDKAAALRDVHIGPADPLRLPAQAVTPVDGALTWLVDREAATLLNT